MEKHIRSIKKYITSMMQSHRYSTLLVCWRHELGWNFDSYAFTTSPEQLN